MPGKMDRSLLICAAIDLEGGQWFAGDWERVVASLKLGLAGDIRQGSVPSAGLAMRADAVPGTRSPRNLPLDLRPDESGAYTLFAGRIMERGDLARRLGIEVPESDAALYASACRILGEVCDDAVVGEYAAIRWCPDRREVRLARSPLNAPPLHVWRSGSRLIAASLPRSIFAAGVPMRIDADRVADVALFNLGDGTKSYYRGLARVACGTVQRHTPDGQQEHGFWDLHRLKPVRFADSRDYVAAASEQLDRAVAANLEGIGKPAISLSGGVDSQSVAGSLLAQLPPGGRLRSYTAVPVEDWLPDPDPRMDYDESKSVKRLAEQYPALEPHFVNAGEAAFGQDLDALMLLGSWPSFNEMNMHWVHAIHRRAANDGCDALFTGDFGDAAFSYDGMAAYPTWLRQRRWAHLLKELRASRDPRGFARRAVSLAVWPHVPFTWRRRIDEWRGVHISPFATWCPLDPRNEAVARAVERADDAGHDTGIYQSADAVASQASMIRSALSEGPELMLALRLLHGMPTREPLAFRPLFELCASMPVELFMRDGTSRWLARQVAATRIPRDVAECERVGVQSADFIGRLRRDGGGMLEMIERIAPRSIASHLFDLQRVRSDIEDALDPSGTRPYRWLRYLCNVPRGLALARFVQFAEGRNDG
ncbi:asparagine synthase-related protein [Altererythrobacter sp.]|uniref:asparagine synthase-related protein n=1 Tax=Altererythrobacter sp. TaxID=1872480 RepID=UPI003D109017